MAAPYVLARTLQEAHTFAQDELGVGRGYYRVVTSPSSIKGIRGTELYVLPGWEGRHDRFAMAGALKWTRLTKIDVAEWREQQAEEPADEPKLDGLEPAGTQPALDADEATSFFDVPLDDTVCILHGGPAEDCADIKHGEQTQAEEPKRRRRRCKECGVLVDPDELEQHNAEHLPSEV